MKNSKALTYIQKYTMIGMLILVVIAFSIATKGKLLLPQNISNLISQNAYVFVLATGMLCCILTGGNIDLSVGSIVCLVGAIAGTLIVNLGWNIYLTIFLCLIVGILIGAWHGMWIADIHIPPFSVTLDHVGCFDDLWWAGLAESKPLDALARSLRRALAEANIPFDKKRFRPHVTFLRHADRLGPWVSVPKQLKPTKIAVTGLSMMLSTQGKNGMIYTELGYIAAE